MVDEDILHVRRFNRMFAQRIGALRDSYQDLGRPLSEARMIYEIGPDGASVRTLRAKLGLDSGYASRLLRKLESQGLVKTRASRTDARVRRAELTAKGLRVLAGIDRTGDKVAGDLIATLRTPERRRLLAAMDEVERLTRGAGVTINAEKVSAAESQWCLNQYFAEIAKRFDAGFDPQKGLPASNAELSPPRGVFLVARLDGQPVGCGALMVDAGSIGHIRRMWIAPEARGIGLGRRMLDALENQARKLGLDTLRLETNKNLKEAQAMYRSCGYRETPPFSDEPYAHYWFEKRGLMKSAPPA